jgi:hypothetical protein
MQENLGGKRLGLGLVKKQAPTHQQTATDRILKVGRKRGRGGQDDESEDDNDYRGSAINANESDDEEEVGRTGIASEPKSITTLLHSVDDAAMLATTNKRKKKGKKEREKEKNASMNDGIIDGSNNNNAADSLQSTGGNAQTANANTTSTTTVDNHQSTNDNEAATHQHTGDGTRKKPRTKTRSRQKNIRKDNRTVKPRHLIAGKYNYQGRPLTRETCVRMGIPFDETHVDNEGFAGDAGMQHRDTIASNDTGSNAMPIHAHSEDKVVDDQPIQEKQKYVKISTNKSNYDKTARYGDSRFRRHGDRAQSRWNSTEEWKDDYTADEKNNATSTEDFADATNDNPASTNIKSKKTATKNTKTKKSKYKNLG